MAPSRSVSEPGVATGARSPSDRFGALVRSISSLSGWRRAAVAFVAGSLSVLSMAPFFLWPVLFLTLPVLVWLIDGAGAQAPRRLPLRTAMSLRDGAAVRRPILRAASSGWWFGFGYFLFGLFWIGEAFLVEADKFAWLLPFAVTLMPAGLALFTALACAAARLAWPEGVARIIVLAITLSGAEWLRGHVFTGFPWNVLGYALTWPLPLMQSAAVLGIYGLTLFTVLIFASPLVLSADARCGTSRRRAALRGATIAIIPLALLYAFGVWQLSGAPAPLVDDVRHPLRRDADAGGTSALYGTSLRGRAACVARGGGAHHRSRYHAFGRGMVTWARVHRVPLERSWLRTHLAVTVDAVSGGAWHLRANSFHCSYLC